MSVISDALDDVFAEEDITVAAVWRSQGAGAGDTVRVWLSTPDDELRLGTGRAVVGTNRIDVLAKSVPQPCSGDTVEIGCDLYRIMGTPKFDERKLVWHCEANLLPR